MTTAAEFGIPEYKLLYFEEKPAVVTHLGRTGLSRIVATVPACDVPNGVYMVRAQEPGTRVEPLTKVAGDKALLFEVSAQGTDEKAEAALEQTAKNLLALVNMAHDPDAWRRVFYREPNESLAE